MIQFDPKSVQQLIWERLRDKTDAPDEFLKAASMSVVATALGKRVTTNFAGKPLTPSLWTVLIGKSTRLRKTTSLELTRSLFTEALADSGVTFLPQSCSFEGFVDAMAGAALDAKRLGEDRVSTGWFVLNEFGAFLQTLKAKYNRGMTETLTDMFNGPDRICG